MTQYALPASDISKTSWTQLAGDNDGDAFDELDEGFGAGRGSGSGPDDAATVWQTDATNSVTRTIECALAAITDPGVATGHIIRARIAKSATGPATLEYVLSLYQGTTLIASSPSTAHDATTYATLEYTLSEAEAAAITDYTALRLRLVGTLGAGNNRRARVSTLEFECPNAGGSVALTVADASHGHAAEAPALTQHNILAVAVQDAAHAHLAAAAALVQHHILAVQDAWHAHWADGPSEPGGGRRRFERLAFRRRLI
jgi:hypothetical protein